MAAGLLATFLFGILYMIHNRSPQWPTTQGVIAKSEVVLREGNKEILLLSYNYAVDGREFKSSRVNNDLMQSFGGLNPRQAVNKYPRGARVTVYYDPADPRDALLEPGASSQTVWGIVFGIATFLLGIWLFFTRSFKEMDRQERWDQRYR